MSDSAFGTVGASAAWSAKDSAPAAFVGGPLSEFRYAPHTPQPPICWPT